MIFLISLVSFQDSQDAVSTCAVPRVTVLLVLYPVCHLIHISAIILHISTQDICYMRIHICNGALVCEERSCSMEGHSDKAPCSCA